MNGAEIARLVELTEGAAHVEMFSAAPPEFGLEVVETDAYVARFARAIDVMMFNRVVGLGLNEPATEESVSSVVQRYRELGITNFAVQLSPEAYPAEIHDWLLNQGLEIRDYWTKLYRQRGNDVTIATDLRIERIDRSLASVFGQVAAAGFGMPDTLIPMISGVVGREGWLHYVAWDGTTAVAVAALMIRGNVGWLGVATTLPDYRRRGAQGALMARRVRDGTELGCEWFVAETGKDLPDKPNPSYHNMLRCGFVVAYDRPNYMLPLAGSSAKAVEGAA